MIKDDQSFHQSHIFIKMAKPLLVLLSMADSNQLQMDKLWFVILMFDYHIIISMHDLNGEDYFPPVT